MISLKKNDKIIVILAVTVLVVAGLGIAVYVPPESGTQQANTTNETRYHVTWKTFSATYPINDECYAGKKTPYTKNVTLTQDNLLDVTIELTWTDDHTYGLFKKKGLDTLSLDVTTRGKTKTQKQSGNGTITMTFPINMLPANGTISAPSLLEAKEKITKEYYKTADESFMFDVSVQTGEKIFRLFKYLRDKGNDFDLKITYRYYDAQITETEDETKNTEYNDQTTDNAWEPPYLSLILKTGCGRYI